MSIYSHVISEYMYISHIWPAKKKTRLLVANSQCLRNPKGHRGDQKSFRMKAGRGAR